MAKWLESPSAIPHNREAEEATIGAVLINPDILSELCQIVDDKDFYIIRHQWIWQAYLKLQSSKTPIDFLTLTTELKNMKVLEEIGGSAYLTALLNQVPSSLHADAYAKSVLAEAIRRRLIASANEIASMAYDTTKEVTEIVSDCAASFQKATIIKREETKSVTQLAIDHQTKVRKNSQSEEVELGIKFALSEMDRVLGYGLKKVFMMVAGRPGSGKTSLSIQFAIEAARQGNSVAFFSLEMSGEQLMNVIMSILTGIDSQRLEAGKLTSVEWITYDNKMAELAKFEKNLHIEIVTGATIQEIRSRCLLLETTEGLDLIVVDYLLRMGDFKRMDENDRANNLSLGLADLQKELRCALIVIHHMNRSFEHRQDGIPILADLTEGGERDPDIVFFLTVKKDAIPIRGVIPVMGSFVKHRNGPTSRVELFFNLSCTTFMNSMPQRYVPITPGGRYGQN